MSTNDLPLDTASMRLADAAVKLSARVAELEQRERDSDKAHACQVARVEILLREKAELEGELAEADRLLDMLTSICKRTALALKGPEPDMGLHDWSDLPEHALLQVEVEARLIADLNRVCAHANALRDALKFTQKCTGCAMCSANATVALASTPAADLAAYRNSVLEEAAAVCEVIERREYEEGDHGAWCGPCECKDAIRALAAQAQEVTK